MATILKAGNVATGAQITSDATGILEIRTGTGAGTTAITVGTDQAVTMAGAVSSSSLTVNSNNISAVNSLGFRNRIINGDMRIAQRGPAAVTTSGAFPVDRWVQFMSGGGVITGIQDSDVPNSSFQYSTKLTVTTADASIAATDFYAFNHNIEGLNAADLGFGTATASTVTLSFWVKSSITGTYAVALYNSGGTRGYPATYTISAANTWTFISLTIPGDTGGTWLKDNGIGITIRYDLGTGSNGDGTANAWNTSGTFAASRTSSTVNWISTLNATFFITGVQLEAGSVATPFERRDYGRELIMCQRYYWQSNTSNLDGIGGWFGVFWQANVFSANVKWPVTMRAAPTITRGGTKNNFYVPGISATLTANTVTPQITVDGAWSEFNSSSPSAGLGYAASYNGQLSVSAEL